MKATARTLAVALLLVPLLTPGTALSFAQESKKQAAGSITGRVTIGGKPAPRVMVLLTPATVIQVGGMQSAPPLRATTDDDGRYRITGVEAGNYRVSPHAPALVSETGSEQIQTVSVADGEEADDIDFALKRGGVITGHVTDAEDRPIIGQRVDIMQMDDRGRWSQSYRANAYMFTTDDRGVYRHYGLAPGRYKVSMGDAPGSGMIRIGVPGTSYTRTFHPDEIDGAKARIIELTSGGEATNVDIAVSRKIKTYVATGRIVDAESGTPVPDVRYGYGSLSPDQRSLAGYGSNSNRTSPTGEFRIEGLGPGRYAAFALWDGPAEFYSEPAVFDVAGTDVSQVEIKLRRGSSISGVAVLEGSDDAEALAKLSTLDLRVFVISQELTAPSMGTARVGADGGFRISGLRPGKATVRLGNFPPVKGLVLLRVEREGVEQRDGIELGASEHVSGVRVVVGHGTGTIRGLVKLEGGEKPPNARLLVNARRANTQISPGSGSAQVDARGRFTLEGLVPGEYEVVVRLMLAVPPPPSAGDQPGIPSPPNIARSVSASQSVLVANGAEAEVTIVLNLGAKDKSDER